MEIISLVLIVLVLIADRIISHAEQKKYAQMTRIGLNKLAENFNRELNYYPNRKDVVVNFKCLKAELEKDKQAYQLFEKMQSYMDDKDKRLEMGIAAIADQLKVGLEDYHEPEKFGVKVIELNDIKEVASAGKLRGVTIKSKK